MIDPHHGVPSSRGSASLLALAVALFILTLSIGCLRLVTAATALQTESPWHHDGITALASLASELALTIRDDRSVSGAHLERVIGRERSDLAVEVRDGAVFGLDPEPETGRADAVGLTGPVPANPVVTDPAWIRLVYADRTRSVVRADQFLSEISARIAAGDPLHEEDIRRAAGVDYALIAGVITAEPLLNVNTAPASTLRRLAGAISIPDSSTDSPTSSVVESGITAMIEGFLAVRQRRSITPAEIASAIDTIASANAARGIPPGDLVRLVQQLSAYLGVKTWLWELSVRHTGWTGTATIVWLPGHPRPVVIGLSLGPPDL